MNRLNSESDSCVFDRAYHDGGWRLGYVLAMLALNVLQARRGDAAEWFPVVARYSRAVDQRVARDYADKVYRLLKAGSAASRGLAR